MIVKLTHMRPGLLSSIQLICILNVLMLNCLNLNVNSIFNMEDAWLIQDKQ